MEQHASEVVEQALRAVEGGFTPAQIKAAINSMTEPQLARMAWRTKWCSTRHDHQIPPEGVRRGTWLLLGGRGSGKSRVGAEEIGFAAAMAGRGDRSLVAAPTFSDVSKVCFEGDSGLLAVIPGCLIKKYVRSLGELYLNNGAYIGGVPASESGRFRGPQWHRAWCLTAKTMVTAGNGVLLPIDRIDVGDIVATPRGPRKVTWSGMTSASEVIYRVTTYAGTIIDGTMEHPIWVEGAGWKKLAELKPGDKLLVSSKGTEADGSAFQQGITNDSSTTDICIAKSMSARLGTSRLDSSYITATKTSQTTPPATFWQLVGESTTEYMQPVVNALKKLMLRIGNPCANDGRQRHSLNTNAPAAEPYFSVAAPAARELSAQPSAWSVSAIQVFPSCQNSGGAFLATRSMWQNAEPLNTATQNATKPPSENEVHSRLTINPATGADQSLLRLNLARSIAAETMPWQQLGHDVVASVEQLAKPEAVYNLTVDDSHEFYANGILTHNCDEVAAWADNGSNDEEAWDLMAMSVRLGKETFKIATTTPKPTRLIYRFLEEHKADPGRVHISRATTYDNIENLSDDFKAEILKYEGTQLGLQEIYAQVLNPENTGIIKRDWIQKWPNGKPMPPFDMIVKSVDTAYSDKHVDKSKRTDPSASSVWGAFRTEVMRGDKKVMVPGIMLLDAWQDHLNFPDLIKRLKEETKHRYGGEQFKPLVRIEGAPKAGDMVGRKVDYIVIEEKASGKSVRQQLAAEGIITRGWNPGRADKLSRLHLVSPLFSRGYVWVPESKVQGRFNTNLEPLIQQVCGYSGRDSIIHDDLLDTTTQALRFINDQWLQFLKLGDGKPRQQAQVSRTQMRVNPYGI